MESRKFEPLPETDNQNARDPRLDAIKKIGYREHPGGKLIEVSVESVDVVKLEGADKGEDRLEVVAQTLSGRLLRIMSGAYARTGERDLFILTGYTGPEGVVPVLVNVDHL